MKVIKVKKTASDGIVIGKAFLLEKETYEPQDYKVQSSEVESKLFEDAVAKACEELEVLANESDIFAGHLMLTSDMMLKDAVDNNIGLGMNAQQALDMASSQFYEMFSSMDDEYMRERAADIYDVRNRLMRILQGKKEMDLKHLSEDIIVIAKDLAPSDTATMDLKHVKGFVTQEGGVTSHVCIMAKGMGIPALVGVEGILDVVTNGVLIAMDAKKGTIIIDPDEKTIYEYKKLEDEYLEYKNLTAAVEKLPAVTTDGREVEIAANAGNVDDVKNAISHNVFRIGLFRSEFLYMENTHFPTENEQFEVYKAATLLSAKELTIRTLDIGGDKELPYYEFDKEDNPFLGWRAIRISLELRDIFKTQLRAILRASAFGHVRIMYPMIISIEELELANDILGECKDELKSEGISFDENIQAGMMIETPASVMMVDEFAKIADFFSIGTNDLTQYMLAVDRGNKKISSLYNSYNPAVLRAIAKVIEAGHDNGIKVGMCGEFASDENAAKILLGLGLDEFSMAAGQTGKIKKLIRETSYEDAKEFANKAIECIRTKDVEALL